MGLHKLFDQGYVTVTPDRDYYALGGVAIRNTLSVDARPAPPLA